MIIADTAWYRRDESGQQMLAERRQAFLAQYGFPSDGIKSLEYLTDERLAESGETLRIALEDSFTFLRNALGNAAVAG